jgi:hypothetical protein
MMTLFLLPRSLLRSDQGCLASQARAICGRAGAGLVHVRLSRGQLKLGSQQEKESDVDRQNKRNATICYPDPPTLVLWANRLNCAN